MIATQKVQTAAKSKERASRQPTQGLGNQPSAFQTDQAKERSRTAGAVRGKRINASQRSAQKRQQARRDSR